MKRTKVQFILIAFVIGVGLFLTLKPISGGQPQSPATRRESSVRSTSIVREKSPLSTAASSNAKLRMELNWVFGGKPQRGWYLYQSLLSNTLGVSEDGSSERFASALSRWQEKAGLKSTGVLDAETLYAIVSAWQGRRLKDRSPAQPGQLLLAPTSDFYDPTRVDELRQVERNTFAAYKRMVKAAMSDPSLKLRSDGKGGLAPDEKFLKIISSFRTREYQDKLRRESPNAGSAGLAVNSPHFTGRALDLYVGGEPVDTNDANRSIQVQTPVYKWLVKNAERFGFRPYYYEPWHWEYVG